MLPAEPKSIVADVRSPDPSIETTVPIPNESWTTWSPGSNPKTSDFAWALLVTVAVEKMGDEVGGEIHEADSNRRQSTKWLGISDKKRDGALWSKEPQADLVVARVT